MEAGCGREIFLEPSSFNIAMSRRSSESLDLIPAKSSSKKSLVSNFNSVFSKKYGDSSEVRPSPVSPPFLSPPLAFDRLDRFSSPSLSKCQEVRVIIPLSRYLAH
jgi:hypothetical protein